jgi:hypothetical protein
MEKDNILPGFVADKALPSSYQSKYHSLDLKQQEPLSCNHIIPQVSVCSSCFHVTGAGHKCFFLFGRNLCFDFDVNDGWYKVCEIPWVFPPHLEFRIVECSPP